MVKVDLDKLARDLTVEEGLKQSLAVAQVKEVLACLGRRWRFMPPEEFAAEVAAIVERAGLRSQHAEEEDGR